MEEALTVFEICQRFKVSSRTVWNRIRSGELPAKKMTQSRQGQWRIKVDDARKCFLG